MAEDALRASLEQALPETRTRALNIRLGPSEYEPLGALAKKIGVPPTKLARFLISFALKLPQVESFLLEERRHAKQRKGGKRPK